jgi:glycosyltransferase involved in cell wall biosynthesis
MAGRLGEFETWLKKSEGLPIEIIIIHDMQDDLTGIDLRTILDRFKFLNIIFYEGHFGSPGAARNKGLEFSLKSWVCFWDSDDLPRVDSVIKAIQEADPSDEIIIGNYSIKSAEDSMTYSHQKSLQTVALNPGLWRMVFRSELIGELRFAPYRMGEDQLFLVKLNLESRKVKFSENIFYVYFRGHPTQLTAVVSARREVSLVLEEICKAIEENPILRNGFTELVKARLFLTLIKNQDGRKFSAVKMNKSRTRFRINLGKLCVVFGILLKDSLVRTTVKMKVFGSR